MISNNPMKIRMVLKINKLSDRSWFSVISERKGRVTDITQRNQPTIYNLNLGCFVLKNKSNETLKPIILMKVNKIRLKTMRLFILHRQLEFHSLKGRKGS